MIKVKFVFADGTEEVFDVVDVPAIALIHKVNDHMRFITLTIGNEDKTSIVAINKDFVRMVEVEEHGG